MNCKMYIYTGRYFPLDQSTTFSKVSMAGLYFLLDHQMKIFILKRNLCYWQIRISTMWRLSVLPLFFYVLNFSTPIQKIQKMTTGSYYICLDYLIKLLGNFFMTLQIFQIPNLSLQNNISLTCHCKIETYPFIPLLNSKP